MDLTESCCWNTYVVAAVSCSLTTRHNLAVWKVLLATVLCSPHVSDLKTVLFAVGLIDLNLWYLIHSSYCL